MNIEKLEKDIKCEVLKNVDMKNYTSFKIGGPAEYFIKVDNINDLKSILNFVKIENTRLTVIGNGSNILVSDKGINGIVIKSNFNKLELKDNEIIVGSGVKLAYLAQKCLLNNLQGFEFASGIPGTIGGAIRMNAGAHGREMKDVVEKITYMDLEGNIFEISNEQAEFKYRESMFSKKQYIILEVKMKFEKGNYDDIKAKMDEYALYRKEKQPIEYPSAGSTFKRGEDFITAKLIDDCGLKGYTIGGAQISSKHAGFIVNIGNATFEDVNLLIEHTKKEIYEKFGKNIETEVEIIN